MAATGGPTVPGIGHLSKKEMMIGGGAAIAVIFIALYRQHKNSQAAASAATANTASTSDVDPTTGLTAGSPEDVAALEAQSSYANTTAYGYTSGGYNNTGYGTGTTGYTSNSQWSQAAQEYITNNTGGDAATVAAALGAYLTGSYVNPSQQTIIEQALAFEGAPPQSGTNGYPPSINTVAPTTPTPPTGYGGPGKPGPGLPPPGTVIYPPAQVKPGFSLQQISTYFGDSVAHILQANPGVSANPPMGTVVRIPFLVKSGMTLESVAAKFMISVPHLQEFLPTSA